LEAAIGEQNENNGHEIFTSERDNGSGDVREAQASSEVVRMMGTGVAPEVARDDSNELFIEDDGDKGKRKQHREEHPKKGKAGSTGAESGEAKTGGDSEPKAAAPDATGVKVLSLNQNPLE
jgi:hypothetical protein